MHKSNLYTKYVLFEKQNRYYYKVSKEGNCFETCKINGSGIGSILCGVCGNLESKNVEEKYIICKEISKATGKE